MKIMKCEKCKNSVNIKHGVGLICGICGHVTENAEIKPTYTPEQQKIINTINNMGHFEMCSLWRFAPSGHPYFDKTLPYAKFYRGRLFNYFGGFTPEISKALG